LIIVQTPLRVSLFGGGTDFRSYFLQEGGCVLSYAIDKCIFVTIKKRFDDKLRIGYTHTEMVDGVDEVQHELIREALRKTGIQRGVEITTMGDIPSAGSGLGSSSTVTVGALHAMYAYLGDSVTSERLGREACEIEIDILHKPIGVQDQYIAAYGGLRFMEFTTSGEIHCERLPVDEILIRRLNESLMLFYTGVTRKSESILAEQESNIRDRLAVLRRLKELAYTARAELLAGNPDAIGCLLHEAWEAKKQMASGVTNGRINALYEAARSAGALGGKISGAGGGGFLLVYAPLERREAVRQALHDLRELPYKLETDGSKTIFNYKR
jgi:D-glycero-alpha-D-manno-heptose-7-phosphate kinase